MVPTGIASSKLAEQFGAALAFLIRARANQSTLPITFEVGKVWRRIMSNTSEEAKPTDPVPTPPYRESPQRTAAPTPQQGYPGP